MEGLGFGFRVYCFGIGGVLGDGHCIAFSGQGLEVLNIGGLYNCR